MDLSNYEKVYCEECKHEFKPKLKTKHHPGRIEENYLQCPECKKKYITHVTDEWCRKEQREIKKLNNKKIKKQQKLNYRMNKLKETITAEYNKEKQI